jgi:hypothetical protein
MLANGLTLLTRVQQPFINGLMKYNLKPANCYKGLLTPGDAAVLILF